MVTEAEFKRTDSEASIGRCRMTNQSRSKGHDAEVPRASCRTIGREAHDDTKPKEGARRVQAGVDHGQQGEGVKGTIPQEARPHILKDDLSQGPKELVSCGQSRVCGAIRGGTRVRKRPEDGAMPDADEGRIREFRVRIPPSRVDPTLSLKPSTFQP